MKTRLMIPGMVVLIGVSCAFAQEFDDMYFRSKDRSQLKTSKEASYASASYDNFKSKHFQESTMLDEYVNPTDSYSARNINPEFIARSNSEQATEAEANYFVEGYNSPTSAPAGTTYGNLNSWNNYNTMNNGWYDPWYSPGWFGPSRFGAWGSPYYGWNSPWMNPWMDPWMSPYYGGFNSGWSVGMGYGWGNAWGPGMTWGMGYNWGNPYYGGMWGSSWNNWGMWNNCWYYRPTMIVVSDGTQTNYAKRPSRTSASQSNVNNTSYSRTPAGTSLTSGNTGTSGSRVRSTGDEYYVRPSRRTDTNSSYSGRSTNPGISQPSGTRSSSFTSPTRGESSGFSSPSRSSGSSGFSSPSRSSSGSSGFNAPSRSSSGSSGSSSGSRRGGN